MNPNEDDKDNIYFNVVKYLLYCYLLDCNITPPQTDEEYVKSFQSLIPIVKRFMNAKAFCFAEPEVTITISPPD